ncbi:hypothetical protein [Myxococcus xanthus]|uniref:hypothetical protein n=1 Tax=Myxococcus xanthus TaxID=34 RepID=UPI00112982B7|nr:hypothetical protein [Myxococcus xanthus]QDE83264.1 hypothetical protein BHS07_17830 [Myxococcus xanthus]
MKRAAKKAGARKALVTKRPEPVDPLLVLLLAQVTALVQRPDGADALGELLYAALECEKGVDGLCTVCRGTIRQVLDGRPLQAKPSRQETAPLLTPMEDGRYIVSFVNVGLIGLVGRCDSHGCWHYSTFGACCAPTRYATKEDAAAGLVDFAEVEGERLRKGGAR